MRSALIGYTGFVGGNLTQQFSFTDLYNSQNIGDLAGKEYDLVVCSGARAEKWKINQNPKEDLANINLLLDNLTSATIKELVLISTVDVLPSPNGQNEDSVIDPQAGTPYGQHRYMLEQACREQFSTLVVRLPGLFGTGLKKNVVYDFLHNNNVDRIHSEAVFQFYYLKNLWKDIQVARDNRLPFVHFATEPVSVAEVAKAAFKLDFSQQPADVQPAFYDFHTKYAELYGKTGNYLYTKQEVLADLASFVASEQTK